MKPVTLHFDKGTLLLEGVTDAVRASLPVVEWDDRVRMFRVPANRYRDIVLTLKRQGHAFDDQARAFEPTPFPMREPINPRPFQAEARDAWLNGGRRGVVVLPTGAGKTILAVLLIAKVGRPTLIHVPTIDLMLQWRDVLTRFLEVEVGMLGGGYSEERPITVTTYDSALLHVGSRGNRFGLAIYDECHRLPGEQYRYIAISRIAPFRLGLTATPERADGLDRVLYHIVRPLW